MSEAVTLRDRAAVVGVGATPYYRRGASYPRTPLEMACTATLDALEDAGLALSDLDGFSLYAHGGGLDPATLAYTLGVPDVRFATMLTSGGGGSAGALGLAAAAIDTGLATTVVTVMSIQQRQRRIGRSMDPHASAGGSPAGGPPATATAPVPAPVSPGAALRANSGLLAPGHLFSLVARRHMHLYGTTREQFAEVCMSTRDNAVRRPDTALQTTPLTLDDYFAVRMVSDPLCLYDYTLESDGAVAVVTVAADRARDLRRPPVYISASTHGGDGRWSYGTQAPDHEYASAGGRTVARHLYEMAGIGPSDVDVALLYDHFSPMVILQLEDFGFCRGRGGWPVRR